MSLFNQLFGTNEMAPILLTALGKSMGDFGRFRDAFINPEGTVITVFTRCGGGNRADYTEVFDEMRNHPNYLRDYDDDFDSTYASIEFEVPEAAKEALQKLAAEKGTSVKPMEPFRQLIQDLETGKDTPETKHAVEVGKKIIGSVEQAFKSGDGPHIIEV